MVPDAVGAVVADAEVVDAMHCLLVVSHEQPVVEGQALCVKGLQIADCVVTPGPTHWPVVVFHEQPLVVAQVLWVSALHALVIAGLVTWEEQVLTFQLHWVFF